MISRLKGTICDIELGHLVIDVNGVGYQVAVTTQEIKAAEIDKPITLQIETIIREDAFLLFGFATKIERDWFQLLTNKVQGVGAKSALAILSTLSLSELASAIQNDDAKTIARTPGVGPKVAQRVIAELKGKLPVGDLFVGSEPASVTVSLIAGEAVSALINLGYDKPKAEKAIKAAVESLGEDADITSLIRLAISFVK